MKQSNILKAGVAPLALGLALVGSPAFAQDEATETEATGESIVVTGSRIARPDLEQASPVAVVSGEEFRLQGTTNVEDVLNDLPQVVPGTSGADNNPGGGIATVDLRGIGPQRTLVLVDGRRYVSYDVNQIVDINTIPSALIQRVDVVTGGRSAVYGSDAIAGVVNFITKRDFAGIELNGQYELSSRGDGPRYSFDGTIGSNFDDGRGNVVVHASYYKRKPIFAAKREFARRALQDNQDGTFIFGGSSSVPQGRLQISGLGALLGLTGATGAATDNADFGADGSLTGYVAATDAYNFAPVNYLQVAQERFLAFMSGSYEISDAVQPYIEAQFINNRVPNELAPTPISNGTPFGEGALGSAPLVLQTNSPFFAPAVRTAFAALDAAETGAGAGDGYINVTNFGFRAAGFGPRNQLDERNAYRFLGGLRGDIGGDWSYDGYFMYSRTRNTQIQSGNVNLTNFLASTRTAFQNPTTGAVSAFPIAGLAGGGTLVCTTPAGAVVAGCVPANLFGNNLSPEAAEYLTAAAINLEEYSTQVATFAITNSNLFDIGAGPIGVAVGVEHRVEEGQTTPDQLLASGNVAGFNAGQPTGGQYSVMEYFAEANVPLLADLPIVNRLEANGAVRFSQYSVEGGTSFDALSWSAGLQYSPVESLTFRGQYQKAIRGPSINELFQGQTVDFGGATEYCDVAAAVAAGPLRDACIATGVPVARLGDTTLGDSANPPTFFGGNEDLREEEATTYTIGAVFQPTFIPRLSVTVDYYNIQIDDFITLGIGSGNILSACYEEFIDTYCAAIERDTGTGEYQRISDLTSNSGGLEVSGIDVSANYSLPVNFGFFGASDSRFSFAFNGSRLIDYNLTPVVGLDIVNECAGKFGAICSDNSVAGEPLPKWKHTLRTTFSTGPFTLSGLWRHVGSSQDDDPEVQFLLEELPAQDYFDLAAQFEPTDNYRFTIGVSNLTDNEPPLVASVQNLGNGEQSNTYPNTYDVLGRYFFVGATVRY